MPPKKKSTSTASTKKSRRAAEAAASDANDGEGDEDNNETVMNTNDHQNAGGSSDGEDQTSKITRKPRGRPKSDDEEELDDDEMKENDEDTDEDKDMENDDGGDDDDDEMSEGLDVDGENENKDTAGVLLRSGRRKRRRSKETTGLTPPESVKNKRARKTTTTAKKKQQQQPIQSRSATVESAERQNTDTTTMINGVSTPAETAASKLSEPSAAVAESPAVAGLDPRRISYSHVAPAVATAALASSSLKAAPSVPNVAEETTAQEAHVEIDESMILNLGANESVQCPPRTAGPRLSDAGAYISSFTEGVVSMVAGGNVYMTSFRTATAASSTTTTTATTAAVPSPQQEEPPQQVQQEEEEQELEETVEKFEEEIPGETETLQSKLIRVLEPQAERIFRIFFLFILALFFLALWPRVADIAGFIVPLDKSLTDEVSFMPTTTVSDLETTADTDVVQVDDGDGVDIGTMVVDPPSEMVQSWNSQFLQEWNQINIANAQFDASSERLLSMYKNWIAMIDGITQDIQQRQIDTHDRMKQMKRLNSILLRHNQGSNLSPEELSILQSSSLDLTGTPVFLTSGIDLWHIPDIDDACAAGDEDGEIATVVDDEPEQLTTGVSIDLVDKAVSDLSLRARMTAEKFMNGDVAKRTVRKWVESRVLNGLSRDPSANRTLAELEQLYAKQGDDESDVDAIAVSSRGGLHSSLMRRVESAIQELLEIDRADKTGRFDHAALSNGATVIYGGKRGTSKSLVDDLPLLNRLLRHFNLRSYGFGPEAALVPTYPAHALGQCWSFRQLTLDEQLKERDGFRVDERYYVIPDDFKRGSLGTLTVRFAEPVYVTSFVIEYPAAKLTDSHSTAVKSFRLVGYEDANAMTKAWNLGSFTYDMSLNQGSGVYLQEFDVPTSIMGHDVPQLNSMSLAIDSNYGGDYTCLYRFRVHGDDE